MRFLSRVQVGIALVAILCSAVSWVSFVSITELTLGLSCSVGDSCFSPFLLAYVRSGCAEGVWEGFAAQEAAHVRKAPVYRRSTGPLELG